MSASVLLGGLPAEEQEHETAACQVQPGGARAQREVDAGRFQGISRRSPAKHALERE